MLVDRLEVVGAELLSHYCVSVAMVVGRSEVDYRHFICRIQSVLVDTRYGEVQIVRL